MQIRILVCSHEFDVLSKSGLSSWVEVIDLVVLEHHVHHILLFTSFVESVLDLVWVVFLEILGVEVILSRELNEVECWVVSLGICIWLPHATRKSEAGVLNNLVFFISHFTFNFFIISGISVSDPVGFLAELNVRVVTWMVFVSVV